MKVSIDTKEDTHEEIKNVIKMLQNLVGESAEILTNEPSSLQEANQAAITDILGDLGGAVDSDISSNYSAESQNSSLQNDKPPQQLQEKEETSSKDSQSSDSESTDDLFAELFSEEEIKKMDITKDEGEDHKHKKKYSIELY